MSTATDNFTGSSGPLSSHVADSGQAWTILSGTWTLDGSGGGGGGYNPTRKRRPGRYGAIASYGYPRGLNGGAS